MRLNQQLVLFTLAAVVLPLTAVGFFTLRRTEAELSRRLEREQEAIATSAAERTAGALMGAVDSLAASARLIDWANASPEEVDGALRLLAAQSDLVGAAGLVEAGALRGVAEGGEGHPRFEGERAVLASALPTAELGERGSVGQVATGAPLDVKRSAFLPVAIQVGPPGPKAPFVVALLGLEAAALRLATPGFSLVDLDGRIVGGQGAAFSPAAPQWRALLAPGVHSGRLSSGAHLASAELPEHLGLFAVVERPAEEVDGPVADLRRGGLLGAGVVLGLLALAGVVFAGRLTRRLDGLTFAARAFGRGELGLRLPVSGADEVAVLSGAFNAMGEELARARDKLTTWNDELKARVDAATAELRAAQAQLLEAQKLAAIGQLGAGVAHEINNPLTGILGNAQLLMLDHAEGDPDFEVLRSIEESAKRCRDITQNLLRFSQSQGQAQLRPVELNAVVRGALALEGPRCAEAQVTLETSLAPGPLEVLGDADQLAQVLAQLCTNARTALAGQPVRRLLVRTAADAGRVTLTVEDTGKGIKPEHLARIFEPFFTTKDVWSNIGLGLSVAYRVATEHQGRLEVASEPGKGARFTLSLPAYEPSLRPAPRGGEAQPRSVGGQGTGIVG